MVLQFLIPHVLAAGYKCDRSGFGRYMAVDTMSFIAAFNVILCMGVTQEPEWGSSRVGDPELEANMAVSTQARWRGPIQSTVTGPGHLAQLRKCPWNQFL